MTDVTIPEDYLPIVDGLLWKKILKEGSGDSPTIKSNVNGTFHTRIALPQHRHNATELLPFSGSLYDLGVERDVTRKSEAGMKKKKTRTT